MSSNDYFYEQVALMIRKGRNAEYIANRLGKSVAWVEDAAQHPEVIERSTEMRDVDLARVKDPQLWKKDRLSLEIQGRTPEILAEVYKVAMNPTENGSTRLKAAELWLKHNEEMPQAKEAASEQSAGIYIDQAVGERFIELGLTRSRRRQIIENRADSDSSADRNV